MNKRQAEAAEAQRKLTARITGKIEEDNARAKRRRLARDAAHEQWGKDRVADAMVPYVRQRDTDSRPVLDKGPPERRGYVHTYGWPRKERRMAMAAHKNNQRRKIRALSKQVFAQSFEAQRAHNAPT